MTQPYVGEIRIFAGNFAPAGWHFCAGQSIAISENETLFNLIGTTYGGDGQNTFNLPDLRGRLPIHQGTDQGVTFVIGETGGAEEVTLTVQQTPAHSHPMIGSADPASGRSPASQVPGRTPADAYASEFTPQALSPKSISSVGGNQPHTNFQPYLCVNFIISQFGVFPSPN